MTAKLLDALGEGFFIVDGQGCLLSINEAGARALGYAGSEALLADEQFGRGFLAHFPEWTQWVVELPTAELPASRRFHLHRRNGSRLMMEAVILERQADAPQGEVAYVGAFQDITASEQLASDLVERNAELESLRQLAVDAVRLEDKSDLFARMLHTCIQAVGADGGALYLVESLEPALTLAAWEGLPQDFVDRVQLMRLGQGYTGTTAQTKEPCFIENISGNPALDLEEFFRIDMKNFVSYPLLTQERLMGVINLFTLGENRFSPGDMALLKALSAQMSLSVAHVRRIDELRERNEELEKFNRLAIDRELRMIELKKRINELERQLETEPDTSSRGSA